GGDFLLGAANAVVIHGMAGKGSRDEVWLLALRGNSLEEVNERFRVIAGSVLVLDPEKIGFAFKTTAEFHERHGHGDAGRLMQRHSDRPTHKDQGHGSQVPDL